MKDWKKIISEILMVRKQDEIAQELGVSQGYISHLLIGRRKNPSYALGVKIEELHKKSKTPSGH